MTRKDYEKIAEAIKTYSSDIGASSEYYDEEIIKVCQDTLEGISQILASIFQADNPKFQIGRFLNACGIKA